MPRWEHGSEERLKQAALELFAEQGFEATTAVQIAERARVTTRTFFRYFADKQEILFADAGELSAALVRGILEAGDVGEPLPAVTRTLAGYAWPGLGSRESQRRREAMIAANPELRERDLIKQLQTAAELSGALRRRGVDPAAADLAARVGIEVFRTAYGQWLAAGEDTDLATTTEAVLALLATISAPPGSATSGATPARPAPPRPR